MKPSNPEESTTPKTEGLTLKQKLIDFGFYQLPHKTIGDNLLYNLGRSRQLSVSSLETPNEMVFISEVHNNVITDLVCLRNYDYDGYTSFAQIKAIINSILPNINDIEK